MLLLCSFYSCVDVKLTSSSSSSQNFCFFKCILLQRTCTKFEYLFAVYLDDLSNELNNIKDGCYIGEFY